MLLVIELQKRRQPSRLASNIVFLASALNRLNAITSNGRLVRFIRLKACFLFRIATAHSLFHHGADFFFLPVCVCGMVAVATASRDSVN